MSADNWARCPRCLRREQEAIKKQREEVDAAYGKVPVEEFDRLRADLIERDDNLDHMEPTFREDYEFYGTETGVVSVSYRGSCTKCGLALSIAEEHPIPGV